MKVVKNFLWNAGYQLFVLLVPLVTIPYVSRVLGPTGIGINSYTNSIVQYFILFGSLGINMYGNREIAYARDSPEKMSVIFWDLSFLRAISIGISIVLYLIFILLSNQYRLFYLLQGIMLLGTAFDISWLFMGLENFRVTVLRNAFVKIAALVCTFIFVKTAQDTWIYILILSASQAIGYLTLWPQIHGIVLKPHLQWSSIKRHIRPAVTLLIPQIATQVYLQLNKTMLGAFQGVAAAGFYDNSDKIIKMVLAIITATGTVLLPHVAHSFAKGDQRAVKRSLSMSMHVILVVAVPMAMGLAAISKPFAILFFGTRFAAVGNLMSVESLVIILIGISNAIGTQYLLPTNQLTAYTTSVVLGSLVNVIANIPLILLFGTMGSIVATVLSEAAVSLYQLVRVKKQIRVTSLFNETWKYFFASFVMVGVIKLLRRFVGVSTIGIVIDICLGIATYTIVLGLLRPKVILRMMQAFFLQRHQVK